jgi:hypothetical protein
MIVSDEPSVITFPERVPSSPDDVRLTCLEHENAALRTLVVELALEIQELTTRPDGWRRS